jgi:hypothetical protein
MSSLISSSSEAHAFSNLLWCVTDIQTSSLSGSARHTSSSQSLLHQGPDAKTARTSHRFLNNHNLARKQSLEISDQGAPHHKKHPKIDPDLFFATRKGRSSESPPPSFPLAAPRSASPSSAGGALTAHLTFEVVRDSWAEMRMS